MKNKEPYKRLIKFSSSSLVIFAEVIIYWQIWNGYWNKIIKFPFWRKGNWLMVALYGLLLLFFLHTYGGLKIGYLKKGNLICSQMLSICFVNMITYIQISLLDKKFHSVQVMILMTLLEFLIVIIWTFSFQYLYQKLFPPKRLLLVYGDKPIFHLTEKLNSREDKYYLAKAVHISKGIAVVMNIAKEYDAVIIGDIPVIERNQMLKECFSSSIRTYTVPKLSDILLKTSSELDIFDSPLLLSRNEGIQSDQTALKRILDIFFSAMGLIIAAPLIICIAMAIKLTDGGPIFYTQKRLTQNGKIFEIYKFRTMVQNAEREGIRMATVNDERILPVGKFLRRLRLDELPQLWNVLKGEMSMVGPRPERPELAAEIEKEIPEFTYRLKVKAGLTGYAQVYGKYNTTSYDKLKLDLNYIRKYSVLLDLKLLLMTPKVMLLRESTEGVKAL